MKQDSARNASYTVNCDDYVHVVKFNPFDSGDACSLIAYGGNNCVVIGKCRFQEEDAEVEGLQYKTLRTFRHGIRVDAIAWSPETRLDALPPQIRLCTAASDGKLRLFTSDLHQKNEFKGTDTSEELFRKPEVELTINTRKTLIRCVVHTFHMGFGKYKMYKES